MRACQVGQHVVLPSGIKHKSSPTPACMQLGDLEAGSNVEELGFQCFDEGGNPTPREGDSASTFTGKVSCGWMRKARRAELCEAGALVMLMPMPVPPEVRSRGRARSFASLQTRHVSAALLITLGQCPEHLRRCSPGSLGAA